MSKRSISLTIVTFVLATMFGAGGAASAVASSSSSHGAKAPSLTVAHHTVSPHDEYQWEHLQNQYYPEKPCLDADSNGGGQDGNKVQLWQCNGYTNQNWAFYPGVYLGGYDQVVNQGWGGRFCLDADAGHGPITNGTKVQLWTCNGQSNQGWLCNRVSYGICLNDLILKASGLVNGKSTTMCLDADLNTIGSNGTKVQLWDCNGQSQQACGPSGNAGPPPTAMEGSAAYQGVLEGFVSHLRGAPQGMVGSM